MHAELNMFMFLIVLVIMALIAFCAIVIPLSTNSKLKFNLKSSVFGMAILLIAFILYAKMGGEYRITEYSAYNNKLLKMHDEFRQIKTQQELIAFYKKKIRKNPNNAMLMYNLGMIYMHNNQTSESLKILKTANKLQPDNSKILFQYIQTLFLSNNHKITPKIVESLKHLQKLAPNDSSVLALVAAGYYLQNKYIQAIITWKKILKQNPDSPEVSKKITALINKAKQMASKNKILSAKDKR